MDLISAANDAGDGHSRKSADTEIRAGNDLRLRIVGDAADSLVAGIGNVNRAARNANAVRAIESSEIARAVGVAGLRETARHSHHVCCRRDFADATSSGENQVSRTVNAHLINGIERGVCADAIRA